MMPFVNLKTIGIREIAALEARWDEPGNAPLLEDAYGFQAFRIPDFLQLLYYAVTAEPAPRTFLDAGAGIGTKVILAREVFGLAAAGIDVVEEYLAEALRLGAPVDEADAMTYEAYGQWDVVYHYGPYREPERQVEFERRLQSEMAPGAVLVAAMPSAKPAAWESLFRAPWQGVWRKPAVA